MEIMKLFFTPDEDLYDKRITDFFDDEVLNSISGSTGAPCLPLRTGTALWK